MKDISEFGVTEALIALGSIFFWSNVAYWGFIRRIEKREEKQEEKQDQQRVNRIGQLVSFIPNEYRNELVSAVKEIRKNDADLSVLVSDFPSEYRTNIAIALAESKKIKRPYVLEQFLRDYTV